LNTSLNTNSSSSSKQTARDQYAGKKYSPIDAASGNHYGLTEKICTDPVIRHALDWGVPGKYLNKMSQLFTFEAIKGAVAKVNNYHDSFYRKPNVPLTEQRKAHCLFEIGKVANKINQMRASQADLPAQQFIQPSTTRKHSTDWQSVLDELNKTVSLPQMATWITPLKLEIWSPDRVVLLANTDYQKSQVLKNHKAGLLAAIHAAHGWQPKLEVVTNVE
jgi:hypothetical protein